MGPREDCDCDAREQEWQEREEREARSDQQEADRRGITVQEAYNDRRDMEDAIRNA